MPDPLGLRRLMSHETNVSDLLHYLTDRDPTIWEGIVERVATSTRESALISQKSADLVLRDAEAAAVGAVELKLGDVLRADQEQAYEETFREEIPLLLAGLDVDAAAAQVNEERWSYLRLSELVGRWTRSSNVEAANVASAATRVLTHWEQEIAALLHGYSEQSALARVEESFLARALTRTLRERVEATGAIRACAGVTDRGGNPVLQAFSPISPEFPEREYIAEVRWYLDAPAMELRFGLDYPRDSRAERAELYAHARRLDDVLRVDRLIVHLQSARPELASLLVTRGSERPQARGDWSAVVKHSPALVNANGINPGFFRDKDFRFEAKSTVDPHRATASDVSALLTEALAYMAASDRSAPTDR